MGKETGFLELDRQDRVYGDAKERLGHYKEFVIPLSAEELKDQASRCMNCGVPHCHTGCPVNNIIPDWNHLVYENDFRNALEVLHSTNNFPEFTGRLCPAPCEQACVLGINEDPVSIENIEKNIVEKINLFRKKFDYVFTTGGIGPTHDDITSQSIAKAFKDKLVLNKLAKSS